jgi:protocatechuate 3,4-dioxygenase beta subunit
MQDRRFSFDPGRREVLYSIGSVVALGVLGCSSSPTGPSASGAADGSTTASCVVTPALTEGPYFVDERLNRSDIRSDPASGTVRNGVLLTMAVKLTQIGSSGSCVPLAGALVDVWHCDALGAYSDIAAQNTQGQRFLRGYQLTDASGNAQFTTIYPGWYTGRAVHLHFKVRTSPGSSSGLEFTSQMFFDESLTDTVYAQLPYNTRGRRNTLNTTDGIYAGGGSQLIIPLSSAGSGYAGTMNVGVRM